MNFFSINADEIIAKNKHSVLNYIERKKDFENTAYRKTYELAFRQLVMNFLRDEVVSHFNFTPEEIEIIMDEDFIAIITEDKFFNIENYVTEDK
jgi:hypothetical protein